jgi:hypothetical protein
VLTSFEREAEVLAQLDHPAIPRQLASLKQLHHQTPSVERSRPTLQRRGVALIEH